MRERLFEKMTVQIGSDTHEMAAAAASHAASVIQASVDARGSANAMFATGNSQLEFIEELVDSPSIEWSKTTIFHMDEYVGVGPDHPASFQRYIRQRLSDRVHPQQACYVRGDVSNPQNECERYSVLLATHPLDLCVLGIGENGHLAFNDPPVADFDDPVAVKVVELDKPCRLQQVGEGHFASLSDVPTHAITVTIPTLLRAGRVIAVVPEARKAEPVRAALTGTVSTSCPASVLRTRDNTVVYLDPQSASLLN